MTISGGLSTNKLSQALKSGDAVGELVAQARGVLRSMQKRIELLRSIFPREPRALRDYRMSCVKLPS